MENNCKIAKLNVMMKSENDANTVEDGVNDTSNVAFIDSLEFGFVEKPIRSLLSHLFPSKVGGRPAWLSLDNLPTASQLKCGTCSQQLVFLLQVYAPIDSRDDCFHRTLFLFMCRNGACYKQCDGKPPVVAFRCQLARQNSYYSSEPPNYEIGEEEMRNEMMAGHLPHAARYGSLCQVCALPGDKHCGSCQKTFYCSKEHQLLAWRGPQGHKSRCAAAKNATKAELLMSVIFPETTLCEALLPEWDLILGPGSDDEEFDECDGFEFQPNGIALGRSTPVLDDHDDLDLSHLELAANQDTSEQKLMRRFKAAIEQAPQQVLRYQWPCLETLQVASAQKAAEAQVPVCERCGSKRQCELQVLPQLLCHLGLDQVTELSPDWGTLLIFSCGDNCGGSSGQYNTEHVQIHHFD